MADSLGEVEIVCSDPDEHRRRAETRSVDVPGLVLPSWKQILDREYEPWDRPHLVLDTAVLSVQDAVTALNDDAPPARPIRATSSTNGERLLLRHLKIFFQQVATVHRRPRPYRRGARHRG